MTTNAIDEAIVRSEFADSIRVEENIANVALRGRIADLERRIKSLRDELDSAYARQSELEQQAYKDHLTGACNRARFEGIAEAAIRRYGRFRHPASVILLDIDHFKRINDTLGHAAGDDVLVGFARVITATIRTTDTLCRWGGEEFVILAENTELAGARHLAGKILARFAECRIDATARVPGSHAADGIAGSFCLPQTASAGVAEYNGRESLSDWIARADRAMYEAKQSGRNRVEVEGIDTRTVNACPAPLAPLLRLVWHPTYECGHAVIDADHRKLFDLANDLVVATCKGNLKKATRLHRDLIERALRHFAVEEALLSRAGLPPTELQAHALEHERLCQRGRELLEQFEADAISATALTDFLVHELVSCHMLTEDRKYFKFFAGSRGGLVQGAGAARRYDLTESAARLTA